MSQPRMLSVKVGIAASAGEFVAGKVLYKSSTWHEQTGYTE